MPNFKQKGLAYYRLGEAGIAQIFIVFILLAVIIAGLYLIKHAQVFKSKAASVQPDAAKNILLANASASSDNPGNFIVLKSEKEGKNLNPRYLIEYQPILDLFIFTVFDTPVETVRKEAEADLLQRSGNNLQSLCTLHFLLQAPDFVTNGEKATDNQLAICKELSLQTQSGNPPADNFTPSLNDTFQSIGSAITQDGGKAFLSNKPIVASEDLPQNVYITLCRNNGTNAEGVWQVGRNLQAANITTYANQENARCNWPIPNYLVFTQDVPVGAYLTLCETEDGSQTPKESFWQIDNSGRVADYRGVKDGCSQAPAVIPEKISSKLLSFSGGSSICPVPGGSITTHSYIADNTKGHCGGGYGYTCNCGTNGRRAKAIDVPTQGKQVILPYLPGQSTQWKLITGPYSIDDSEGGGYGYTFEATAESNKWYLDLLHMNLSKNLSLGNQYPPETAIGTTAADHVHMIIGKNLSKKPVAGSATDCDPNWLASDFMCQ